MMHGQKNIKPYTHVYTYWLNHYHV